MYNHIYAALCTFINFRHFKFLYGTCQVRALFDDGGSRVDEAGPSMPVQVCNSYFLILLWYLWLPFKAVTLENPFFFCKAL